MFGGSLTLLLQFPLLTSPHFTEFQPCFQCPVSPDCCSSSSQRCSPGLALHLDITSPSRLFRIQAAQHSLFRLTGLPAYGHLEKAPHPTKSVGCPDDATYDLCKPQLPSFLLSADGSSSSRQQRCHNAGCTECKYILKPGYGEEGELSATLAVCAPTNGLYPQTCRCC